MTMNFKENRVSNPVSEEFLNSSSKNNNEVLKDFSLEQEAFLNKES